MIDERASSSASLVLFQAPSHRQRAARRRAGALAAVICLAAAGWLAGSLIAPSTAGGPPATGPFSYFPS